VPEVKTIPQFFIFLRKILTDIPRQREMTQMVEHFHYLIGYSPGNILNKDEAFAQWLTAFAKAHGSFLDTTESAECLSTFIKDPEYYIEDYDQGPSGWLTFNQFFTRRTRPGKRPVAEPCNERVIVAATDSVYLGCWPVDDQSKLTVKGRSYSIEELLDGSPYGHKFRGGVFTHSYLNVNDYHRYHVPLGGVIKELRKIPGNVIVDLETKPDGSRNVNDDIGFQVRQTRGLAIMDSVAGLVALLPVGMGHASSVNFTAEVNSRLVKGEELGYFAYGGSDMIMLFQQGKVEFTAKPGIHYKQGEKIGVLINE